MEGNFAILSCCAAKGTLINKPGLAFLEKPRSALFSPRGIRLQRPKFFIYCLRMVFNTLQDEGFYQIDEGMLIVKAQ